MEVYVLESNFSDHIKFVGKFVEVVEEKGRDNIFVIKETGFTIPKTLVISRKSLEGLKNDFQELNKKQLMLKYDIKVSTLNLVIENLNLVKINKAKLKEKEMIIKRKIREEKRLQRIKEKKPKRINFLDEINKNDFIKDYTSSYLSNKDLVRKYNHTYVTLWLTAKKIGVERPTIDLRHKNIVKPIIITKEQKSFIKQYAENPRLTKKWLKEKTKLESKSLNVRIDILKFNVKDRQIKLRIFKHSELKNIRRDFLYLDTDKLMIKYNLTTSEYKSFKFLRPQKSVRNNLKLYITGFLKCSKCGEIKELGYFPNNANKNIIKYKSACKDCRRIASWKRKGLIGEPTATELKEMKKYFNNKCIYCSEQITPENYTLDHIIPRTKGGTNNINNIAIACFSCNTKKYTTDLKDYMLKGGMSKDNYDNVLKYIEKFKK